MVAVAGKDLRGQPGVVADGRQRLAHRGPIDVSFEQRGGSDRAPAHQAVVFHVHSPHPRAENGDPVLRATVPQGVSDVEIGADPLTFDLVQEPGELQRGDQKLAGAVLSGEAPEKFCIGPHHAVLLRVGDADTEGDGRQRLGSGSIRDSGRAGVQGEPIALFQIRADGCDAPGEGLLQQGLGPPVLRGEHDTARGPVQPGH